MKKQGNISRVSYNLAINDAIEINPFPTEYFALKEITYF
jgi:hypothetical protein